MCKSLLKNDKGSALVMVMMALLVLSLLIGAVLTAATANFKTSLDERELQSSYYIAEAGAVYYMQDFKNHVVNCYSTTTTKDLFFEKLENERLGDSKSVLYNTIFEQEYGTTPKAKITLQRVNELNPRTYTLVSRGSIDNVSRTVTKTFTVKWLNGANIDMAVFSLDKMTISNGFIVGPIGTNLDTPGAITLEGDPDIDNYYLRSHADITIPGGGWNKKGEKKDLKEERIYGLPEFPAFPAVEACTVKSSINHAADYISLTLDLDSDITTYIPEIVVSNGATLTIDLHGGDRVLLIDDFNIPQGKLRIIGDGNLKIYLTDTFSVLGDSIINQPVSDSPSDIKAAIEKLSFYVKGTDDDITYNVLGVGENTKIYGSLYAQDSNITIPGSSGFQGNIVTGGRSVTISGDTSVITHMIYAPGADVIVTGSGKVYGPIICNTFHMSGGGSVEYDPLTDIIDDPFFGSSAVISSESPIREK